MKEFPILEKNDIVLRKLELFDFDSYFDYVTDETISRQFNFNYNQESAKNRLEELVEKYTKDNKPYMGYCFKKYQ